MISPSPGPPPASSEKPLPFVTVITPAYNAARYIAEAIDSIRAQTYSHFEHIIVDDCSTDDTRQILARYAQLDRRIRVLRNEANLGIAGSRNKGLSVARGKYIMWQDADDISMPYRMQEQVELLERALEAAIDRALRIDRVRIGVVVRNPHTLRSLSFLNNHSLDLPGRR